MESPDFPGKSRWNTPEVVTFAVEVNQEDEECNGIFQGYIKPGIICVGEVGTAPCDGNFDGPLVCPDGNGNKKLAEIVSFDENGCTKTGVYTCISLWRLDQWKIWYL